jgi:hypothetical protein
MTLGFLVSLVALIPFGKLIILAVYPAKFSLWLFIFLVKFFAGFPFSAIKIPSFSWLILVAYYLIAFVIFYLPNKSVNKMVSLIFSFLAVILLIVNFTFLRKTSIYLISAKYSKSVLIRTKNYKTILVDAGIKGEMLAKAVMAAGSLKLDGVFLSSLNYSSFYGLRNLADVIKIKNVYLPNGELKPKLAQDIAYLQSKGIKFIRFWAGDVVSAKTWQSRALWGLNFSRDGKMWRKTGYSGFAQYDGLSYLFTLPEIVFETGSGCRFVRILQHFKTTENKFNIISNDGSTTQISFKGKYLNVKKI